MKIFDYKKIKTTLSIYWKDPFFLYKWDNERIYQYGRRGRDNKLHENIYGGYSHDPYYLRSHTHMLIQDMQVGVMPTLHFQRGVSTGPKFIFTNPPTSARQRLFIEGISGSDRSFDITQACTKFIEKTTQRLMAYGRVYYELVYKIEGEALSSLSLESIPEKYLFKIFGNYYQVIPWWVAYKANTRAGIIKIPGSKVLDIRFPSALGGKRGLRKILKRTYKITEKVLPSFTTDSMKNNEDTGFDTNEYVKDRYLEIAKLTKSFGWNQRSTKNDYTTEFYYFKRYLDSQLAFVILRSEILEKLNCFLQNPITNLGTTIQMEGYTTKLEIDEWRSKMKVGGIKFIDLFNVLKDR